MSMAARVVALGLVSLVIACRTTPVNVDAGYDRLDPALAALVRDPARVAELRDAAVREKLPFEVEVADDGTVVVPVFIDSRDASATAAAVRDAGGTASTMTQPMTARVPVSRIQSIAARTEVVRIEPSSKRGF